MSNVISLLSMQLKMIMRNIIDFIWIYELNVIILVSLTLIIS